MVHDARRVNEVEGAALKAGVTEIGLDKLHALESEPRGCGGAERERCAREIGAHHHAVGARAEALQTLTRRIARKRRALVEAAHRLSHAIRRQSEIGDTVSDVEARCAS